MTRFSGNRVRTDLMGRGEVAVTGDHNRCLEPIVVGIIEQANRDVTSVFFSSDCRHLFPPLEALSIFRQEVTEVDLDPSPRHECIDERGLGFSAAGSLRTRVVK